MTLHLAYVCPTFVVTVGDRLLTTIQGGTYAPFDAYSNKTVVVVGTNCAVAVAYTGLAHIDGDPTANWIGEQILGRPLHPPRIPGSGNPVEFGRRNKVHLGEVVTRIRDALQRDLSGQHAVEIAVAGMTFRRGWSPESMDPRHTHPVYIELKHSGEKGAPTQVDPAKRMWRDQAGFKLFSIGTKVPPGVLDGLVIRIRALRGGSPDKIETLLVEAIRRTALHTPVVGSDCMAVRFIRGVPEIQIRFSRDPARTAAAFTPFVIGSNVVVPPQIGAHGTPPIINSKPWTIIHRVAPPLPSSRIVHEMGSHAQRRFPG